MQKRLLSVALSAAFLGGCGSMAKEAPPVVGNVKANGAHLADGNGNVVKSGTGGCLRSGTWSEDNLINKCEGIEEKAKPVKIAKPVVKAEPKAEPAPIIETVILNSRALFSTNADSLSAKGDQAMRNLIAKLGGYSKIEKVDIIGHTDSTGSDQYNQQLSEKRAATIKQFIVDAYADADINATGVGETQPVASNDTAEGRQQNRRVEIRVTAKVVKK